MAELIIWKQREIDKLRKDMEQLFKRFRRDFGVPFSAGEISESLSISISDTGNSLLVKAEIPDINPEDLDISVTEDTLIIKGEVKKSRVEEGVAYKRIEKRSRSFSRTFPLPCRIKPDEVNASFKDDILEIYLPKCELPKPREISIKVK